MQDKIGVELLKEIGFRAQVLGFVPQEYVEPIATFIETTSVENPDRLVATIDKMVSMYNGDPSAHQLLRRLMENESNKTNGVHEKMFRSPAIYKWTKKNHDFLVQRILKK